MSDTASASTRATARPILLVDDEEAARNSMRRTLRSRGFEEVVTLADGAAALAWLERGSAALMLLDLAMPGVRGEEVLANVAARWPELPVVVVTGQQEVRTAVTCMKLGAFDYLLKPVEAEELLATVEKVLEQSALRFEAGRLRETFFAPALRAPEAFAALVTVDPAMHRLFAYLEAVSRGNQPVLIAGETGTGKELVARALHQASGRDGPFVAVNAAGLDDAMFADTLFGHEAGAYTGALKARAGMVERAGTGTLFLDEIGDLAEASQVKLLRLIQEREYYPLGSDHAKKLRARVVAATHREPAALRQDLYYRLRAYHVRVPPLRERPGDLPVLAEHFLAAAAADLGRPQPQLPAELAPLLARHPFPGNVRELQALVFDAVARSEGPTLSLAPFLENLAPPPTSTPLPAAGPGRIIPREEWRRLEGENLLAALAAAGWRISGEGGAAELLGMKPSTLESRMKALGIERP